MRRIGFALTFLAGMTLAAPPTVYADQCYTYPNRYIGYFQDCDCTACAGWALTNCTECFNDDYTKSCQTTSTSHECIPILILEPY